MLFIAFEDFPISIIESEPTGINPCIEEVGGIHNFQVKVPIGIKSGAKEAHVRKYQFHEFFFKHHRHAFFYLYIYYFRSDLCIHFQVKFQNTWAHPAALVYDDYHYFYLKKIVFENVSFFPQ